MVPVEAKARKAKLESWLQEQQLLDPWIWYQICSGDEDVKIFIKIFEENNYSRYREIYIKVHHPLEEAPDWDLEMQDEENEVVSPTEEQD